MCGGLKSRARHDHVILRVIAWCVSHNFDVVDYSVIMSRTTSMERNASAWKRQCKAAHAI